MFGLGSRMGSNVYGAGFAGGARPDTTMFRENSKVPGGARPDKVKGQGVDTESIDIGLALREEDR